MGIERAAVLYPRNNVTVDTGAGINVRVLDDVNGATDDITQNCRATNAQDNVERTFEPATGTATNTNNAGTTLFKMGWALRLAEDMTPADDTNCNAYLPAGTVTVTINVTLVHTGGTGYTGDTHTPTWRASLWRYDTVANTGTLIAAGSDAGTSWQTGVVGNDEGTYKDVAISIVVASAIEFLANEVLLLQVGLNTGTLANPLSGTTNYDFYVKIDRNSTKIAWAASQGIRQVCTLALTATGKGAATESGKAATLARSATGKGTATESRVVVAARSYTLDGRATATRQLAGAIPRTATGKGTATESRVVVATKSFALIGQATATRQVAAAMARSLAGKGTATESRVVVAAKSFALVGVGTPTHLKAVAEDFDIVGKGTPTESRVVVAAKSFTLDGRGTATRVVAVALARSPAGKGTATESRVVVAAKSFTLDGRGIATESRTVQAQRSFSLTGLGTALRQVAVAEDFDLLGAGTPTYARAVVAAKAFVIDGRGGLVREGLIIAFLERTVSGKGAVTDLHPVQAFRAFDLVGKGLVPSTGPNASTITLPLDEIPTEGGGGTTIVRKLFLIVDD